MLTILSENVVIPDNYSIHKSKKFVAKMEEWKENDVMIFFLPPYSPELNLTEIYWSRIKYQWITLDVLI